MANHGVVTYGSDLLTAYMNMETVEHFAKIALVVKQLGCERPLAAEQVTKLQEMRLRIQHYKSELRTRA
jgi:L-fuculose-phosphate aldolase